MEESVSTQNNGLRTYRPPLDKFIFPSEEMKVRVLKWLEGVPSNKVSRALLLSGPHGLGKTTLALALCDALGAQTNDIREINGASQRGIDEARELISNLNTMPMMGDYRIIILDEIHQLTPPAIQALLTPIENLPKSTVFIAATSAPELLNPAFRSRFYEVRLEKYSEEQISEALENLPIEIPPKNIPLIARAANGNMRRAIDLAEGGMGADNQEVLMRINAIEKFYPFLMNSYTRPLEILPLLILILDQVGEAERKQFFERTMTLLEGTWMTLVGQKGALTLNDQKLVTEQIASMNIPPNMKDQFRKFIALCYKNMASLQDKPVANLKAMIMGLMP